MRRWISRRIYPKVSPTAAGMPESNKSAIGLAAMRVIDIRGSFIFRDVLIAGGSPGDRVQIHAVFGLQDAPGPETRRDGVAAIDRDRAAFQVFRFVNSRVQSCRKIAPWWKFLVRKTGMAVIGMP